MKKDDLSKEQADKIISVLDDAIQEDSWEKSRLLNAVGQRLQGMRAAFKQKIDEVYGSSQTTTSHLANRVALRQGQQLIYVSLYSVDGSILNSWERIVYNLSKQVVSRPIYSVEGDVKAMIRSKANPKNEAYVSVYVAVEDILSPPPDKVVRDKLGQGLLSLKDKALQLENLVKFFHESGIYHYQNGRLIREGDMQLRDT